jgi:hypothetical protein
MPMRTVLRFIIFALLLMLFPTVAVAQRGAVPDDRIIEWLRSPTPAVRQDAVAHVLRETSPTKRSVALERALVDDLAKVNEEFKHSWQMSRAGKPLSGDFPAEYHFDLIEAVSQSS